MTDATIAAFDSELSAAMVAEAARQEAHIELIASENYTSPRVLEAQGSVLTNKYAEGYPGKRYYGGCEHVDEVERLAIERAKALFGAAYANVQPHSGSQANAAVFLAPPAWRYGAGHEPRRRWPFDPRRGAELLWEDLPAVQYGIDTETGLLDYDAIRALALEHKPKMLIGGFSAYSRIVDWARLREIADEVGAWFLVDMAHVSGLVAAGVYPSPVPHAHVVTSTTHKTLAGPRSGIILACDDEALHKKLNSAVFPGSQGGPLMHVIAAKAVCFKEAMEPSFKAYQAQVVKNAQAMADTFLARGYNVVSGGTDNHLFLLDLIDKDVTGKAADAALGEAHITVNKNAVPNDPRSFCHLGPAHWQPRGHAPGLQRGGRRPHGVDVRHHRRAGGEGRSRLDDRRGAG